MSNEIEFEYTGKEEREDVPKDVTIVRFISSVIEVGEEMFQDRYQLKEVILNEGLQKIGDRSFFLCSKLEHINLPSTLIGIGNRAFSGCQSLREVVLNKTLQTIGIGAFGGCTSLERITIPSFFTEISERTFHNCHNLETVILNEGIQKIESDAFGSCLSLERITIPHTVTEIGDDTFFNCQSLREVELHEGIQTIGTGAFGRCLSLERFSFPNLATRLDITINDGKYEDVEVKVDNIIVRGFGIRRRGSELFISDVAFVQDNWIRTRGIISRIDRLITYYEVREATTLLELAMWKSKIDQASTNPINRDVYRIDIPGPVKDSILQFLNFRV